MPVEIRKVKEKSCELYSPEGELLGVIKNDLQFLDVRLQIAKQNLKGYYIRFNKETVDILETGKLKEWPNGLFDKYMILMGELFKISLEV